jgi:hypothetical protein
MADKALLIGINAYSQSPLRGCLNDIEDMAQLLVQKFKFKPEDVRLLADQRATTSEILDRLQWLIDLHNVDDRCFFHYSGHGAQVASRNYRHEVDGLLEIIVPYDFNWTPQRMITDKTFLDHFNRITHGVNFNWVSDSCHSGDLTRNLPGPLVVQIPKLYPTPVDIAWRNMTAKSRKVKCRSMVNGVLNVGFVSGCRSDQTSADTVDGSGRPCGALTHFLIDTLKRVPVTTPLRKVVEETSKALAQAGYSQRPQCEGARADKPLFGS